MSKLNLLILMALLFLPNWLKAQDTLQNQQQFTREDTLAILETIKDDLAYLLDSAKKQKKYYSFWDINTGVSNGFFVLKSNPTAFNRKAFYNLNFSFIHSTGLGLSLTNLATTDANRLTVFQTTLSPSLDFVKNKNWSFGFAYFKYFTKQNLSFYTSPLTNEYYAYLTYKGGWLKSSIALDYGTGTQQTVKQLTRRITVTETSAINDFAVINTFKHSFDIIPPTKQSSLSLTPTILLISGTQRYGLNQQYVGLFNVGNRTYERKQQQSATSKSNFQLQTFAFLLNTEYATGDFYIQPQWYIDYGFTGSKKWNSILSVNLGFTF